MADRFPGGVISKTPPTVVGPVDGEGGSASGVWTLAEQLGLQKAGSWPQLTLPRELYAWGVGSNGALGDGTAVDKSSPVQVGTLTNWSKVATVGTNSFSIKTDGTLWAWGNNVNGQLGQNNVVSRSSPVQVGSLTTWAAVGSTENACAAIRLDGTLWTWGSNNSGQLGHNDQISRSSPVQVGALLTWAFVSEGGQGGAHVFSITTNGQLYAWGNGTSGQLGDGISGFSPLHFRSSPVQIGALTNWAYATAGGNHSLAVKTDGTMWSWGNNGAGYLGQNNLISLSSPVQVGALTNWRLVDSSNAHVLAVKTVGTMWSWGINSYGELGQNNLTNQSSPVQVGSLSTWEKVATTGARSSVAIKTDGTLWAWGNNSNGALGDGTTINKSSPIQVGADTNWSTVSCASHVIAITKG